ncbi:MAG: tetratricopeptide repeat protein [Parabacteroides sp.]|nr:tetratricopeptide repeat protein [Parabacteroides sp.]MDD7721533.1 tetratricopeptide repeat protein [bacterium]MDY4844840.1 tetratricopeptide repeat protein [Parabacteroides sp.]
MKEIERMIFILLWIICTACNSGKPSAEFDRLEQLMPHHPDSVLQALDSMDTSHFSERERAYYYLLQTEAEDKCYVEHTTDSLISRAADYFRRKDDRAHYAKALYLKGRIYEDWHQADRADSCWFRALDAGKESGDNRMLYRIAYRLGNSYAQQSMADSAMSLFQKALTYAELAQDSSSISYSNAYIGRVYTLQKDWNRAEQSYLSAIRIAHQSGSLKARQMAFQELLGVYTRQGALQKADSLLLCLESDTILRRDGSLSLVIGNYYRHLTDTAKSIRYLMEATLSRNPYTVSGAYQCLHYLYKDANRMELAVYYDSLYHAHTTSSQLLHRPVELVQAEASYQIEKIRSRYDDMQTWCLLLCASLFVSILLWILSIMKKRNIMANTAEEEKGESREIENSLTCPQTVKNNIVAIPEHTIQLLERIDRRSSMRPLKQDEWDSLFAYLDYADNGFIKHLQSRYPLLTQQDLELCALIRLGCEKGTDLAVYLSLTLDGMKKRKQKLKYRLRGENGFSKRGELEHFIRTFSPKAES